MVTSPDQQRHDDGRGTSHTAGETPVASLNTPGNHSAVIVLVTALLWIPTSSTGHGLVMPASLGKSLMKAVLCGVWGRISALCVCAGGIAAPKRAGGAS